MYKSLSILLSSVLALSGTAMANTVFFDSFEAPEVNGWWVYQDGVGDTGGWTAISGTGIEIQDNGAVGGVTAYHGEQYVELDSDYSRGGDGTADMTNSAMATLFDFVVGQEYQISFAYRPRTNTTGDNGIELFTGMLNGSTFTDKFLLLQVSETTSSLPGWTVFSTRFTATESMNAFGFGAFGKSNSLGGFIDAVEVSAVPIPGAALLFLSGIVGLGASRRRRSV